MKIAVLAPSMIPSRRANSIQTMKMAQAFCQLGHQVLVLVPGETPDVSWDELKDHYGLQTEFEIKWLTARPLLRAYDYTSKAVKIAQQWGAKRFLTRVPQAAVAAVANGLPTIFEIHNLPGGRMAPWLLKKFLSSKTQKLLVPISNALALDLKKSYHINPNELLVAHDGVDLERYVHLPEAKLARKQLKLPDRFTVGYTGHLYPGRGGGFILKLAAGLPEVAFLLAGGNPDDINQLKSEAAAQGLNNVHFLGFVSNQQLPLVQAAADVLIMPYQDRVAGSSGGNIARYLSPMKLFEYLASARPILASHLPVLQEVLNDENAILLSIESPDDWLAAIRELIGDANKRQGFSLAARKTAEAHSWQARGAAILAKIK